MKCPFCGIDVIAYVNDFIDDVHCTISITAGENDFIHEGAPTV